MKLASATINDGQHEWQKLFVEGAEGQRIGDKVKTEIYPASQLGAIPRMAEGVSLGTIESFITPTVVRHQSRSALPDLRRAGPVPLAGASICGDPGPGISRSSGDHVPRQGPARDRRDLQHRRP